MLYIDIQRFGWSAVLYVGNSGVIVAECSRVASMNGSEYEV